jgi:predicted transcriptional regulator
MRKKQALQIVNQMPENFQVDELVGKLMSIEKIEEGLEDIQNNNLIDQEEVIRVVSSWYSKIEYLPHSSI